MRRSIEAWSIDFMHAARALSRAPGFTSVTIVTLVLAIGSNAAIFSVVETVLLDPVKYPAADRLVVIRGTAPGTDLPDEFGPGREFYVQYGEQADMLEDLAMWGLGQTTVRAEDLVDRLFVAQATPTMFTTLGVAPLLGRLPVAEDDAGSVIVLSHWLWTSWFGSDPAVIGRSYEVSGTMRTVIGVMDAGFRFPDDRTALWVHLAFDEEQEIRPGNFGGNFIGRMKPGITHTDLESQLAVLASRLPERFGGNARYAEIIAAHRPIVRSLEEDLVGDIAKPLWLLLGTVGIVLLIACANVANLFMVRAEGRSRDMGVRQALGAGRAGLIRTQMAEALLLALAGGMGGALLAWAGLPLLVRAAPESIPNLAATRLDSMALGFTAGLSLFTACVFGLIPAIRFSRPRFVGALRQDGVGGKPGGDWSRNALVLVQTSSALVLLVGAGLLMRSFWTLNHVDPGYDTENIFSFQVAPQRDDVNDGPSYARFHQMFAERVAALPGVESVGFVNTLPLDEGAGSRAFFTENAVASGERLPPINFTMASSNYFATMGIELLRGRGFEPNDHTVGPVNMLVSSSAANLLWPGQDAIGERLAISSDTTFWMTVVGVVEDIFLEDFRQDGPDPMMYLPLVGVTAGMWGVGSPAYVVKSSRADVLAPEVRALMKEVVPESPMYRVFTMEGLADRSMAQLSFTMLMLAIASGLALILGAVGLYGVLSYVVSNRAREIAVRMALGAESHQVQRMVVLQGARVAVAGIALGLAGAVAGTRVLDSLLFGVGTLDIATFVVMGALMLAVALIASYLPARRASLMDPMDSLRGD